MAGTRALTTRRYYAVAPDGPSDRSSSGGDVRPYPVGPRRRRLGSTRSPRRWPMQREDDRPLVDPADHRRRTRRAERHATSDAIHRLDPEELDAAVPMRSKHDLGHKTSPKPKSAKPGRRSGFKVWKTPFWKRRK